VALAGGAEPAGNVAFSVNAGHRRHVLPESMATVDYSMSSTVEVAAISHVLGP